MKILLAMSGGIDSSLAAAILKEKGHEVVGATMNLWPGDGRAEDPGSNHENVTVLGYCGVCHAHKYRRGVGEVSKQIRGVGCSLLDVGCWHGAVNT